MLSIKFRQPIITNNVFQRWHEWGFIGGVFFPPVVSEASPTADAAELTSQQFIGYTDKNKQDIFVGDLVKCWIESKTGDTKIKELAICLVVYKDSAFCIYSPKNDTFYSIDDWEEFTVVGNNVEDAGKYNISDFPEHTTVEK